jgi:hypothetical protein
MASTAAQAYGDPSSVPAVVADAGEMHPLGVGDLGESVISSVGLHDVSAPMGLSCGTGDVAVVAKKFIMEDS